MVSVDVMAGGESPISLLQPPANLPRRPICFSSGRALQLRSARDGQASVYTAAAVDQKAGLGLALLQSFHEFHGHGHESLRGFRLWGCLNHGRAGIAPLADG